MYIINAKMGLTVKDLKDRIDNFKIIECGEPVYGLYAFLNNSSTVILRHLTFFFDLQRLRHQ